MKILVLAPSYPHAAHSFAGVFHERFAIALKEFCEIVEVLVPRPYAPQLLSSLVERWTKTSTISHNPEKAQCYLLARKSRWSIQ